MEVFSFLTSIVILIILRYFICKLDKKPFSSEFELPTKKRWKDLLSLFLWGGITACFIVIGFFLYGFINKFLKIPEELEIIPDLIIMVLAVILTIHFIHRKHKTR